MSHEIMKNRAPHPARAAAIRSIETVEAGDREGWLENFHAEAVLEDPVGVSPMDPEGKGHHGIDAIAAFWDNFIGTGNVRFHIRESFACGNECANVGTITTRSAEGAVGRCELVMVYKVDAEGKVLSLRAFWEVDEMMADFF
ncbi:nuclear transport factor 2 family protein [Candidatus Litorirhabdus singularis]|nr:nuclear transport factor 2 family protein [Candidatus Litorirhabdus singularis]